VPCAQPGDAVAEPKPFEHPQPVRRQRHPGPDLGQPRCLLVHLDVDPGLRQRERHRGPADPAADDHCPQRHFL
jgi:hypothetical protein